MSSTSIISMLGRGGGVGAVTVATESVPSAAARRRAKESVEFMTGLSTLKKTLRAR